MLVCCISHNKVLHPCVFAAFLITKFFIVRVCCIYHENASSARVCCISHNKILHPRVFAAFLVKILHPCVFRCIPHCELFNPCVFAASHFQQLCDSITARKLIKMASSLLFSGVYTSKGISIFFECSSPKCDVRF